FSSRRRHTRFSRDWSSDVCSSDLIAAELRLHAADDEPAHGANGAHRNDGDDERAQQCGLYQRGDVVHVEARAHDPAPGLEVHHRSEERRVGNWLKSWWAHRLDKQS